MPFDQLFPRSFTASSIREHAPARSGVYGLANARAWIYIGETDNLQATLLAHLRELDTPLQKEHPTGFVFEVCDHASRAGRQGCLIREYAPAGNRRWSQNRGATDADK